MVELEVVKKESGHSSPSLFLSTLKDRYCLNPFSDKATFHLVLDIQGSGFTYSVGDCIGVHPQNPESLVDSLLEALSFSGDETVFDRENSPLSLRHFLLTKANLTKITKKLLKAFSKESASTLTELVENRAIEAQAFVELLLPLLPRYYSIASSMTSVGHEVHLTVGLEDEGICSSFLCQRVPFGEPSIPIFIHPSRHFFLPPESFTKPIIMIGPGTGVAPFRGFLQERVARKAFQNWLFFGERKRELDFYYREEFETLLSLSHLELDCAFSRDQEDKIYVQHKMLEKSKKIWEWLEQGAYLFVCGDATSMAKAVEATLLQIIEKEGQLSQEAAKIFFKQLRQENRFLKDVY